ncbi:unnamed protein product, partial [Sphacelaria rigidula]
MFVVKRDGRKESVAFDKITARISKLCYGLDAQYVEPVAIAQKASTNCILGSKTS